MIPHNNFQKISCLKDTKVNALLNETSYVDFHLCILLNKVR